MLSHLNKVEFPILKFTLKIQHLEGCWIFIEKVKFLSIWPVSPVNIFGPEVFPRHCPGRKYLPWMGPIWGRYRH